MSNKLFGAHYFHSNSVNTFQSSIDQLYFFKTYIGKNVINVELGDSVYFFDDTLKKAIVKKGPCKVNSLHLATVIRGYMHPDTTTSLEGVTSLPYVNGCSTKQLFAPIRLGDPTLQYLKMPPSSKEQEHHIHSTFRVVYILSGRGRSVVGMKEENTITELEPGSICILEPMCPHHFETYKDEYLIAIPLHVFSSVGGIEKNHPMFNGTILI
ncbi:Cupin domain-containing protein [Tenacibaculum sp. MAR_2009_124]|uniref:cupin domain-containing protein n=1 Tax=Tenacibaculum sp. MAR_2009_124 TaxID=1250059 RepID=UPI00089818C4|nr:cupin domain-containing protein [Tenacibaculum sp. MAR_2009_124]SEB48319.1 Cupin domain-containing protein [Tenacibaculum sp. MAR_2009_124]